MPLLPGDPSPYFTAGSTVNPKFEFDTVAGRYDVLIFLGSAAREESKRFLEGLGGHLPRFDDRNATFPGVSVDPDDERTGRLKQGWPGFIYFFDADRAISKLYGAEASGPSSVDYVRHTLVLDPGLRVLAVIPFGDDPDAHLSQVLDLLDKLTPVDKRAGFAPVLVVPFLFEAEFCRKLIGLYEEYGGRESGFMRDVGGQTVQLMDPNHKRRRDCEIVDPEVIRAAQMRLHRRLVPEIKKAFQFHATRIERHIVACYDAAEGATSRPTGTTRPRGRPTGGSPSRST